MLVNAYQEGRSGRLLEPPGASRTSGNLLTVILASSHPFPTHSGKGRASGGWSLITEVPLPIQEGLLGSSCSTTQWIPASHPPTLLLNTPYQADQLRLPKKKNCWETVFFWRSRMSRPTGNTRFFIWGGQPPACPV